MGPGAFLYQPNPMRSRYWDGWVEWGRFVGQAQDLENQWASKGDSILGEAQGLIVTLPPMPRDSGSGQAWAWQAWASHGHCPTGNLLRWATPGVELPLGNLCPGPWLPPPALCRSLLGV